MTDWDAIVRRHGCMVWQTAYRLLGNYADASDCFQEAFVGALEVSRRQRVRNWRGLLRSLATRRALDRLRRRMRETSRSGDPVELSGVPSNSPGPARRAEGSELYESVRRALGLLPAKQAEAFCLRYLEDMSYRQIAGQLGLKSNAVGVLLQRARSRLRDLLAHDSAAQQE